MITGAAAVALVVGGLAGANSLSRDDAAPLPPSEENEQELEPMRNGRIIRGEWVAFDQDTASFLYDGDSSNEGQSLRVVRRDEPIAEFDCPPSANCNTFNSAIAFGPGPDEVTVPGSDQGSAQVIAFAGTVRNTLDISPVVTRDQRLTDLAWSPDGSRLALSTASDPGEEGRVWILDRDGGEPQVVFTEDTPDDLATGLFGPVLEELAWSPDGRTLTLLVGFYPLADLPTGDPRADAASSGVWPRLVALRLPPGEPVRPEPLHVYDDVDTPPWNLPGHERLFFASAWSPDGTRIAVTSGDGFAEISAEDGHVLARHQTEEPLLFAWLPRP
jgi:WD40 repeat protein